VTKRNPTNVYSTQTKPRTSWQTWQQCWVDLQLLNDFDELFSTSLLPTLM